MSRFQQGNWVWIHDDTERFLPAKVLDTFTKGEETTVMTEDGEKHKLTEARSKLCEDCNPEALDSHIDDLVNISDLNEMSILHNLRIRFKEDKIYTSISSILISVNPFKLLPLYTPAMLEMYRNGSRGHPPHIFAIAINAYNSLLSDSKDQSVVISGESGAGKSEATKLILQLLTDVSSRTSGMTKEPGSAVVNSLEAQILAANPILEAFGNAKTLRNNNSSRFGKLITVNFDQKGAIIGGGIINYLLEKSRVVFQTAGERNYHIFYQLLTASETDPKLTEELKLQNADLFNYTSQSGVNVVEGISDDKDFEDIQNSMNILRFDPEIQKEIFKIVAGVLHFGNLKFQILKKSTEEDASEIVNIEVLQHASTLWGCDPEMMGKFLTNRHIGTRSVILVGYTIQQALDARDAMVKRVYSELFQFIVNKINSELSSSNVERHKFIGVLDIFGFESFEVNSFEQLCINYCNEKLQFHFNEHIFKMEQSLYLAEGISIPGTAFVDNQPTLDLLEAKAVGIFSMVDEEINVPRGSDDGLLQKILNKHADGKHPNCVRPKTKDCKDFLKNFGVLHYAGPVFYNINSFLEKNKDQLHSDIVGVLQSSTNNLIQNLFPEEKPVESAPPARGRGAVTKAKTLGFQFKTQLKDLIDTLEATHPHFVRCMKSNDLKAGGVFNAARMQDQLRYAGLVEVCRIRKLGYPVRRAFDEFYKRFKCIDLLTPDLDSLLKVLSAKGILKEGEWAKGHTKVFMRTLQSQELELARENSLVSLATLVQRHARRMIAHRRFKLFKKILDDLKEIIIKRSEAELVTCLDAAFELPWNGTHLAIVKEAKSLLVRIREEKRITQVLENALVANEISVLESALKMHSELLPPFETPLVKKVSDLLERLKIEAALIQSLNQAISARNLATLQDLVAQAAQMDFKSDEVSQAQTVISRLLQEEQLLVQLKEVMAASDLDSLNNVYSQCIELGMETYYTDILKQAKAKKDELVAIEILKEEERKRREEEEIRRKKELEEIEAKRNSKIVAIKQSLINSIASKDIHVLNQALQEAMQESVQIPEVDEARHALENLKKFEEAKSRLKASSEAISVKTDVGINALDLQPLQHAIALAESLGTFPELTTAKTNLESFEKQSKALSELEAAISSKDRVKLRTALDTAEDLEMKIPAVSTAREKLKELEASIKQAAASSGVSAAPSHPAVQTAAQPYDEAEEARRIRQEIARQPRFDIRNYPNLRSSDDYARGVILHKARVKEQFLSFQNTVIPKSLTDINKDNSKYALQIFKDLLGYMGDKQMPYPAMLAQDILRKGYEVPSLRDEIYLQIVKQLTANPRPESVAKGWQVMCMCVGTFPPSPEFENFLLHYIIDKRDKGRGAVVDYARYCLRTLEAMLNNGEVSGFVPSVDEISAYKDRPPILATIYLVDGNIITENLPITPDLNVAKVIEMCSGWLDLKDPRISTLGMFVYDLGENDDARFDEKKPAYHDLIRTPRPMRNEDFMGDIIVQKARQRRKFKFVLKRKIFLDDYNYRGDDPSFERMTYLQAEDETIISGNLRLTNIDDACQLGSISMAVAFGEDFPDTTTGLIDNAVTDFIPPYLRNSKSPEEWASMFLHYRSSVLSVEPDDLQDQFIQIVQKLPMYGSHFFYSHKAEIPSTTRVPSWIRSLPRDIILAFNSHGMFIFDFNFNLKKEVPYTDICRWGGSSSQFSLIMCEGDVEEQFEFVLITAQAADMAAIILDHIRAIMAEQEN